ncbi:MAG: hypothetical protein IKE46_02405 [Selenomonadaceae bacterium]|nr:hypothetical protein [Selenomonadaceae bacterium]
MKINSSEKIFVCHLRSDELFIETCYNHRSSNEDNGRKKFPRNFMPIRKKILLPIIFNLSGDGFFTIKFLPTEKQEGGNFLVVRRGN